MDKLRVVLLAVGAGLSLAASSLVGAVPSAFAQTSWPQRSVRFIVPMGPGSGADLGARLLADPLAARWGKTVVVDNRPGGDAMIAITSFIGAHDDHTLLYAPASTFTAHPYLHEKLPYKQTDFVPIARVSNTIITMVAPANLKVGTLAELLVQVRTQPGRMNWATATGFSDFLLDAYLKNNGLKMSRVPYRDPVKPATDASEGIIQLYWGALAITRPYLDGGKLKLLATSNTVRIPDVPTVPTVAEAGFPTLTFDGLVGLFGPRDMAQDVREHIATDVKAIVDANPTIGKRLLATGQMVSMGRPAEFAVSIEAQRATLAKIAKDMGITPAQTP